MHHSVAFWRWIRSYSRIFGAWAQLHLDEWQTLSLQEQSMRSIRRRLRVQSYMGALCHLVSGVDILERVVVRTLDAQRWEKRPPHWHKSLWESHLTKPLECSRSNARRSWCSKLQLPLLWTHIAQPRWMGRVFKSSGLPIELRTPITRKLFTATLMYTDASL